MLSQPLAELDWLERDFRQPDSHAVHKLIYLESARGLAALAVVFHHLSYTFVPDLSALARQSSSPLTRGLIAATKGAMLVAFNGEAAVRFFFVLSGFVLSLSYVASGNRSVLRSAAFKRYPRLAVPVLGTALIGWGMLSITPPLARQVAAAMNQPGNTWAIEFLDNRCTFGQACIDGLYRTFFNYQDPSINCSLWTMSYELFNSYGIFVLLAMIGRARQRFGMYALTSLVLTFAGQPFSVDFIIGVMLADVGVRRFDRLRALPHRSIAGAALVLAALPVFVVCEHFIIRSSAGWARCAEVAMSFVAGAVVIGLLISPALQFALRFRLPVFIGKISFGIYLIHVPVLASAGLRTYLTARHWLQWNHAASVALAVVITLGITGLLATLMHYLLELTGIRLGKWLDAQLGSRRRVGVA